jgi:hypothetical protein
VPRWGLSCAYHSVVIVLKFTVSLAAPTDLLVLDLNTFHHPLTRRERERSL